MKHVLLFLSMQGDYIRPFVAVFLFTSLSLCYFFFLQFDCRFCTNKEHFHDNYLSSQIWLPVPVMLSCWSMVMSFVILHSCEGKIYLCFRYLSTTHNILNVALAIVVSSTGMTWFKRMVAWSLILTLYVQHCGKGPKSKRCVQNAVPPKFFSLISQVFELLVKCILKINKINTKG